MVSGTKKYVQIPESRQKTAKKTYAPYPVSSTRGGVISPYDSVSSDSRVKGIGVYLQ